jgi:hypothetical protein
MKNYFLLSFSLLLMSCASTRYFNQQYKGNLKSYSIGLYPLDGTIISISKDDQTAFMNPFYKKKRNDYKNDNRPLTTVLKDSGYVWMYKAIKDSIPKLIRMNSIDTSDIIQNNDKKFKSIFMKIGRDSIQHYFRIPKKEHFSTFNTTANIVIIINKIEFTQKNGSSGIPMMGATGMMTYAGGSPPSRSAVVKFVIWDAVDQNIVSCGTFTTEVYAGLFSRKEAWANLFREISFEITNTLNLK